MDDAISMPVTAWPQRDRELWLAAAQEIAIFDATRIATWQPSTKRVAETSYGAWLRWLATEDRLTGSDPATRLSAENVKDYVRAEMKRGLSIVTVANRVGRLVAVVNAICPGVDLTEARKVLNRLKRHARKQTHPRGDIVHAAKLYGLGFELMGRGRTHGLQTQDGAELFVDGLVIALLTACPIRIGNYSSIRLDREMVRDSNRWRILVSGSSTKTEAAEIRLVPFDLTASVDDYVCHVRPYLLKKQMRNNDEAFFIGCSGRPLRDQMMRRRIVGRTRAAFGKAILPHAFRKAAITTLVLEHPHDAPSAPLLLTHNGTKTAEDYYIIRQQLLALDNYHAALSRAQRGTPPTERVA